MQSQNNGNQSIPFLTNPPSEDLGGSPALRFPLNGTSIIIGRDPDCDVVLTTAGVSRRHAEISLVPGAPAIRDLKSSFGTRIDGSLIDKAVLHESETVTIGIVQLRVGLGDNLLTLDRLSETQQAPPAGRGGASHDAKTEVSIGRDSSSDIQCNHPLVSRYHATLQSKTGSRAVIVDHASANGTFVNGRQIRQSPLDNDDIVQIGPFRFFFRDGVLTKADDSARVRIESAGLKVVRGNQTVLRDVSLCVQPGEFVVILGPSGAGKTTLGHALTGRIATASGQVFMNGMPLKRFAAAYTSSVGFVGQHDLLYAELTVVETFRDQALLRLPADSTAMERSARVDEVLELLDLSALRNRRIGNLSGGEAKRVHLGVELLASPPIIFLDEPLAGLDFGLIGRFMALFKRISLRGHTVMLTTHTLEQIELADRIVFVDRGRVRYQGAPAGITTAFGVASLAEIYDKARSGHLTVDFDATGDDPASAPRHDTPLPFVKSRTARGPSLARQYRALVARYTTVLRRDTKNLLLLVVQIPLMAILLALVYRPTADFLPISFYFCIVIAAIWAGGVSSVREIARDWEILDRDVRAGLRLPAYLGAKLSVFGVLAIGQAALFAGLLRLCFEHFALKPEALLLLACASLGGAIMGLMISSMSPRVSVAVSWLPVLFIPQVFFSGVLVPFDRMTAPGEWLSRLTIARPVFGLFKRTYILDAGLWTPTEWIPLIALVAGLCILIGIGLRLHIVRHR